MSALEVFSYDEHQVRTVLVDGEPWFVLADLARVLDVVSVGRLASRLDDGVRQAHTIVDALGREQRATIVSEAGMYEVVIRSDKPHAAAFRRWITHEVLPSIRRTGGYAVHQEPAAPAPAYRLPETFADALRELADTVEQRDAAQARVQVLEPAAEAWETVTTAAGSDYSVAEAAQTLTNSGWAIGQTRLFDELHALRWILRTEGHWRPYQRVIEQGLLTSRLRPPFMNRATGKLQATAPQVRVTAKGIEKLLALYQDRVGQLALAPAPEPPGGSP